jgi:hypothetical protein
VIVVLAVAAAVVAPSLFRSTPVARGAPPARPPAAPTGLAGKAFCIGYQHMGMNLRWDAVNTEDVDGYVVYRFDMPETWPIAVARLDGRDATAFVDRTLRPGGHPTYYVRAISGRVASAASYSIKPHTPGFCF